MYRRMRQRLLKQPFARRPDALEADVDSGLSAMVCLVFEGFQQEGKPIGLAVALSNHFSQFACVKVFDGIDGVVVACVDVPGDGVFGLGGSAFFQSPGVKGRLCAGGHVHEEGGAGCQVEHLLGKAADAVYGFEGIFVGGHGIEVVLCIGFAPFPFFDKLIFDVFAGDILSGEEGREGDDKQEWKQFFHGWWF